MITSSLRQPAIPHLNLESQGEKLKTYCPLLDTRRVREGMMQINPGKVIVVVNACENDGSEPGRLLWGKVLTLEGSLLN